MEAKFYANILSTSSSLKFAKSCSHLELDNTLDILAIRVRILGGEVDGLTDAEGDCLLGLAGGTSVIWDR